MNPITWLRVAIAAALALGLLAAVQTCRLRSAEGAIAATAVAEAKEKGFHVEQRGPVKIDDKPAAAEAVATISWEQKPKPVDRDRAPTPVVWASDPEPSVEGAKPEVRTEAPAPGSPEATTLRPHWLVPITPPRTWPLPTDLRSAGRVDVIRIQRTLMARVRSACALDGPDGSLVVDTGLVDQEDVSLRAALDSAWSIDLDAGVSSRPGLEVGAGFTGPRGHGAMVRYERAASDRVWHLTYRRSWRF